MEEWDWNVKHVCKIPLKRHLDQKIFEGFHHCVCCLQIFYKTRSKPRSKVLKTFERLIALLITPTSKKR